MGWTEYSNPIADPQAEIDRMLTWECEERTNKLLLSRVHGRDYQGRRVHYAAVETITKATGERKVWCAVTLFSSVPFGYKDMCDSMGPNEDRCPREILELLTPLPPPPVVTHWSGCDHCGGKGKLAPPNAHIDCFYCDGKGEVPTDPEQRDRHRTARNWRRDAWAHHGGEPQGVQLSLLELPGAREALATAGAS